MKKIIITVSIILLLLMVGCQPSDPCTETVNFKGTCKKLCTGVQYDSQTNKCIEVSDGCCSMDRPFTTLEECQNACE